MSSLTGPLKRFLYKYAHFVDFLSASFIICLCLIVLLPKVHDSFHATRIPHGEEAISVGFAHLSQQPDHHERHHKLPLGEVLICAGFFAFYCIGMVITKLNVRDTGLLLPFERRISTVCCSSTRCPSGQREVLETSEGKNGNNSHEDISEGAHLLSEQNVDEDCVLLLNRHHNHHTHNRHHDHRNNQPTSQSKRPLNYGSTLGNNVVPDLVQAGNTRVKPTTVYVEEIRISRVTDDQKALLTWPLSTRMTLFSLLLAGALILFDMNIHGLMISIRVFRAAATGALLYIAFFLVLPKNLAGCKSCSLEEA